MARSTICWYYVGEMKTIRQQKWAFKWFHTLLFLLKNRLSYRSFISTWRKSTTSAWNVLLSDSIQLLLYTYTVHFLTHSFIRQILFFSTSSGIPSCSLHMLDTLSHCSSIGVWRYSQKYLTLKDVWRFDYNAPFFSTSCIKAIKKMSLVSSKI